MYLPHPRVKVSIVGSLRDREVACSPQTTRARISNPVSGGQCHLIHLTILMKFSWPSLTYMCTKVSFHLPLKYSSINHGDQRVFQFEIIINVLVSSSRFIGIPEFGSMAIMNMLHLIVRGSTLHVRIWEVRFWRFARIGLILWFVAGRGGGGEIRLTSRASNKIQVPKSPITYWDRMPWKCTTGHAYMSTLSQRHWRWIPLFIMLSPIHPWKNKIFRFFFWKKNINYTNGKSNDKCKSQKAMYFC